MEFRKSKGNGTKCRSYRSCPNANGNYTYIIPRGDYVLVCGTMHSYCADCAQEVLEKRFENLAESIDKAHLAGFYPVSFINRIKELV
jgi:hypothetical protein